MIGRHHDAVELPRLVETRWAHGSVFFSAVDSNDTSKAVLQLAVAVVSVNSAAFAQPQADEIP